MLRRLASLLLVIATTCMAESRADGPPVYEAYAVRYATLAGFPVSSLVRGAENGRKLDIAMTIWALKGPAGRTILVDSGFYRPKLLEEWKGSTADARPDRALAPLGIRPEDVTDVVITHMHWDHADGADLFPKARIWIQKDEYIHYVAEAERATAKGASGVPDHVAALAKLHAEGRVSLVDGDDREILPGVAVYTGGRHTFASQYVAVDTRAADNVYLYENLDKHAPIAQTLDAAANLAAQDRMRRLASGPKLIIPGHDPDVFARFPAVAGGIARLD